MTKPASEGALNGLHEAVAQILTRKMESRTLRRVVKDEVVEEDVEPTASEIMAAITFLKNNNIQAVAEEDSALARVKAAADAALKRRESLIPDQHAGMPAGMH